MAGDEDARILRHALPASGDPLPREPGLREAVADHLRQYAAEPAQLWTDPRSEHAHVDVLVASATDERPYATLMTAGMAARPMTAPDGTSSRAELLMLAPPALVAAGPGGAEPWPSDLLRFLALIPATFSTWLGAGHTIPNGDPPAPWVPFSPMTGALIAPLLTFEDPGAESFSFAGEHVEVYGVHLLHTDEMELKLRDGISALYALIDENLLTEVLEPDRPSIVPGGAPRRRWWKR